MGSVKRPATSYSFGSYELIPQRGELRKLGKTVRIAPQPYRVLILLVERAGEIVTREELRALNWGDNVIVDFEMGLNRCIRRVRAALMDDADAPRYVETVPKLGYRFIAPIRAIPSVPETADVSPDRAPTDVGVDLAAAELELEVPSTAPPETPVSDSLHTTRFPLKTAAIASSLAIILAVAGVFYLYTRTTLHGIVDAEFTPTPLSNELGFAFTPSFSPGGEEIAFAWNGKTQDNFDVYVKMVGSPAVVRVTDNKQLDFSPAWSPNGRFIAFCRGIANGSSAIWITSALGGTERKIIDLRIPAEVGYRALTWTPDGNALIFSDFLEAGRTAALFIVSFSSGKKHQLTFPPSDNSDVHPAMAPDGHALVFSRDSGRGVSQIHLLRLTRDLSALGQPEKLAWPGFENVSNSGPKWTPDSKQVVFISNRTGEQQLWKTVPERRATPKLIASVGTNVEDVAISRDGALAIVRSVRAFNIWRLNVEALLRGGHVFPVEILASTRSQSNPRISPDSRKIAFESDRSGFSEIWMANADGTDVTQLTNLRNPITGSPSWSHDGTRIAFDSRTTGTPAIYVLPSDGGIPITLVKSSSQDVMPDWSRDDKWIYFTSNRSGTSQVWKVASAGGLPQQVTQHGGFAAVASPEGHFLYYSADRLPGTSLKRMDLNTGAETDVAQGILPRKYFPTSKGVFYVVGDPYSRQSLFFYSSISGRSDLVAKFDHPIHEGIGVSPDGSQLFYGQLDQGGSDLLYVEKFWR